MASNLHRSNAAANAANDAMGALLNGGYLRIYDSTGTGQPADANTAVTTQVLLAELRFGSPAFAASVAGVAVSNPISDDPNANASGTATWFRCLEADGVTVVFDGSIATSGADMNFSNIVLTLNQVVSVTGLTITATE